MLVFRDGIHKMLVRITNREDPDQKKQSDLVLHYLANSEDPDQTASEEAV